MTDITRDAYHRLLAKDMRESTLVDRIVTHARSNGWLVNHQRPSQNKGGGWRTATQGDTGFPDLVLTAPSLGRVIFVECKSHTGTLEPEQKRWRDTLLAAGADWRLWRPMDWLNGHIENVLPMVED